MTKVAAVLVAGAIMTALGYMNVARDFLITTGAIFCAFSLIGLGIFASEFFKAPIARDNERENEIKIAQGRIKEITDAARPNITFGFGRAGMPDNRTIGFMVRNDSAATLRNVEVTLSNIKFPDGRPLQNITKFLTSTDGLVPPIQINPGGIKYFRLARARKNRDVTIGPFSDGGTRTIAGDKLFVKIRVTADAVEPYMKTAVVGYDTNGVIQVALE